MHVWISNYCKYLYFYILCNPIITTNTEFKVIQEIVDNMGLATKHVNTSAP